MVKDFGPFWIKSEDGRTWTVKSAAGFIMGTIAHVDGQYETDCCGSFDNLEPAAWGIYLKRIN